MHWVDEKIKELRGEFEELRKYSKDKKISLGERMKSKRRACVVYIGKVKELREYKSKEENVENRTYFMESETFLI